MITLLIFTSIEFYVIATMVAAAVIALCVRPSGRGEARTHLLAGILCSFTERQSTGAAIILESLDNGDVLLTRTGLQGLTNSGAVSLAVTIIGFDITIEERITIDNHPGSEPVDTALFTLDFLAPERYHIQYRSEETATFAAFNFINRPSRPMTFSLTN